MKRIVDGKLYDTDTATHVATSEYDNSEHIVAKLFVTPLGNPFIISEFTNSLTDRFTVECTVIDRAKAVEWLKDGIVEIHDLGPFADDGSFEAA